MLEYLVGLVLGCAVAYLLLNKSPKTIERQTLTTRDSDTVIVYSDELVDMCNSDVGLDLREEFGVDRVLFLPTDAQVQVVHKHYDSVEKIRDGLDKLGMLK